MTRRSRRAGQLATLALVGFLVVAFPAGFALAQDLADPGATTQSNHTVLPIINLTSTPTETPTVTATRTATPRPTETTTPTPTSGGGGDGGGDTSGDAQRLVVNKGGGTAGGVTSEEDCSNANYTTIQRAVDDAAPGDTVLVCAGTYTESVTVETGNITLRANGDAVIESSGQPAIRATAPRVIVRGFTIRTTGAEYSIAVGGRDSLVRDNTVELTGNSTGIFLSDGRTSEGDPHPELGVATGSRVVQNTVNGSASTFSRGVFTDADQTVVRDNTFFGEDNTTSIRSSGNQTVIRDNTVRHPNPCIDRAFDPTNCNSKSRPPAILIGEDNLNIRGGPETVCHRGSDEPGNPHRHNWARQNLIVNNSVIASPGHGVYIMGRGTHSEILAATKGTAVRHNTLFQTGGIGGWTDEAVFQNNTVDVDNYLTGESAEGNGAGDHGVCLYADDSRILNNVVEGYFNPQFAMGRNLTVRGNIFRDGRSGVQIAAGTRIHGNTTEQKREQVRFINNQVSGFRMRAVTIHDVDVSEFHHNKITNNGMEGVIITGDPTIAEFQHNRITGSGGRGIVISRNASVTGFHYNLIDNNEGVGVHKENTDKSDEKWPIVNATYNYWGCGGPSGGLQDPVTNRTANGTGDSISAGDKAGVSNVRFDPFYVRQDVSCPNQTSNPTPTTRASPTSTPTPTPPPSGGGDGDDTGGDGGDGGTGGTGGTGGDGTGAGSGEGSGEGEGSDSTGGESGSGVDQSTPPPTPASPTATATPPLTETPTPTATLTPTPAVEPGFGIAIWLIGFVLVVSHLALRRRKGSP